MRLECDVFNSIYEQVGPKCPFFKWIDNPIFMHGNEAAHFGATKAGFTVEWVATCTWKGKNSYPGSSRSYLNGRNCSRQGSKSHWEGEKVSSFLYSSQGDSSESFRVREKVQNCTNSVMVFFFFLVMLFSCFGSSENVEMMRLNLPDGL